MTMAEKIASIVIIILAAFCLGCFVMKEMYELRLAEAGYKLVDPTPIVQPCRVVTVTPVGE